MTEWIASLITIIAFIALLVCGVRIGFAAMIAGIIGLFLVYGDFNIVGVSISGTIFSQSCTYAMTVIPLFIFMGYLALYYGLGDQIYTTVNTWLGWLPGGLAVATTMGCAFFGAICGVSAVSVAVFGRIAIPQMDKAGYHWSLSVGSVAASGTLADLIPPSTLMVIYAMLTQQSVGRLLIAGFIPGIISAIIYSVMIILRSVRNPRLGPRGLSTSLRDKISSLKGITVVFIVLALIIGGLYSGIFTPTEVGACGSFIMLLSGFIVKRGFHWPLFRAAIVDTARITCMIFILIIGIKVMSTAIIATGAIGDMVSFFQTSVFPPYLLLFFVIIIYIILGAFVGVLGMMVMTVPFLIPILAGVGFHPIWLGVIVIKFCEIGLITPPIGGNVFVVSQVTGRDLTECFKSIVWFLVMDLLTVGVFIAFPQIILFLPSRM